MPDGVAYSNSPATTRRLNAYMAQCETTTQCVKRLRHYIAPPPDPDAVVTKRMSAWGALSDDDFIRTPLSHPVVFTADSLQTVHRLVPRNATVRTHKFMRSIIARVQ